MLFSKNKKFRVTLSKCSNNKYDKAYFIHVSRHKFSAIDIKHLTLELKTGKFS